MSILKVYITRVPSLFLISYFLVPKIEICPKYFLDKIPLKQPLWACNNCCFISHVLQKSTEADYVDQM